MRNKYFTAIVIMVLCFNIHAQIKSEDGKKVNPSGTYMFVNFYVNIIYDVTSDVVSGNSVWPSVTIEGFNVNSPVYADNLFASDINTIEDVALSESNKLYEMSFSRLKVLGDGITVNIKQSRLSSDGIVSISEIVSGVIDFINDNGGLNVLSTNGFSSISDYDMNNNGKIDMINFFVRNPKLYEVGGSQLAKGGLSVDFMTEQLKINSTYYNIENGYTIQPVMGTNLLDINLTGFDHEFAHKLLGGNAFHASGANHWGTDDVCTFMGLQSGFGLMHSRSSLQIVNGYERWRLNWTSPVYNTGNLRIQASNTLSDIKQSDGNKTFYLRDFVTTGDAIRIKLPYKDAITSSNQYIWLENHQVGRNGKTECNKYSDKSCVDLGSPGIYSYIQVGKDVVSSYTSAEVFPENETDNLKMLDAQGNYDVIYTGLGTDCMGWEGATRKKFKYTTENPLSGQNDMTPLWNISTTSTLSKITENVVHIKELANGSIANGWPRLGENSDAFQSGSILDISSNPSPVNAVTQYVNQYNGVISLDGASYNRNTYSIYLTGLSIKMYEDGTSSFGNGCKIFRVEIEWDDYDVKNDIRWTGNICMKEELNLLAGNEITLNQSTVPTQPTRDAVSGEFTPTTTMTCDENSNFYMRENSSVFIEDKSSLVFNSGSNLNMYANSKMEVNDGCTFRTLGSSYVSLAQSGASLIWKCGSIIEMENDYNVFLDATGSELIIAPNVTFSSGYMSKQDLINFSTYFSGTVKDFSDRSYSGKTFYNEPCYANNLSLTNCKVYANRNLVIEHSGEVTINGEFTTQTGSSLTIKATEYDLGCN